MEEKDNLAKKNAYECADEAASLLLEKMRKSRNARATARLAEALARLLAV